jgi:hypothetical protein
MDMTKEERKEWNKQYYLLNKDKYKTGYNKHKDTNPEYKSIYITQVIKINSNNMIN